jgi:serine/threonine protein kinase
MADDLRARSDSQKAAVAVNPLLAVLAAERVDVDPDDLTGTLLDDRYRLVRILGQGGMGYVYLAEHVTLAKAVAVKVLSSRIARAQDARKRFLQEAKALSAVSHDNVVTIFDYGETPNGSAYFAMELLSGESLADLVAREAPLPWPRVKTIALQICRAIHAAHERGVLHRDIKPENCFRTKRGANRDFIKVLDFGIAKICGDERDPKTALTKSGTIFGTPEYMSPEQARGKPVDARTDVYSLGILLYELVTGSVPFVAETFLGVLTRQVNDEPVPPSSVSRRPIPPDLETIILKCLRKDPADRFQSVRELAEAIASIPVGGPRAAALAALPETMPSTGSSSQRERLLLILVLVLAATVVIETIVLLLLARMLAG